MTPPIRPEQDDVSRHVAALRAQGADDATVDRFLTEQMGMKRVLSRPRGFKTPEEIEVLNKADQPLGFGERVTGGLRSIISGLTLGNEDEVEGNLRALTPRVVDGRIASRNVEEEVAGARDRQAQFSHEFPKADLALNILPSLATGRSALGRIAQPFRNPVVAVGAKAPLLTRAATATKNAVAVGGAAGMGYGNGETAGEMTVDGLGGAALGLGVTGALGAAGGAARLGGAGVRALRRSPDDKTLAYLRTLAQVTPSGPAGVQANVAAQRAAGGQPILAEAIGETGLRGLEATTRAPLSRAGEIVTDALTTRSATTLPRADDAALKTVDLQGMSGVRGLEYLDDWIQAIRRDETAPLYLKQEAQRAAVEGAEGKARARLAQLLEQANVKALPAPGQSTVAGKGYPDPARLRDMPPENVPLNEGPNRIPTTDAPRTTQQQRAMDALNTDRGGPKQVVMRAANDIDVRNPEFTPGPPPAAPRGPSAVEQAVAETQNNRSVRTLLGDLETNPDVRDRLKDPGSFDALETMYHAINARIRDITGSTEKNTAGREALQAVAKKYFKAMEEIAPASKEANTRFAQLSQPRASLEAGHGFDKMTKEEISRFMATGNLPDGTAGSAKDFQLGMAQRLREILSARSGAQSLRGAAKPKNPLEGLNREDLAQKIEQSIGPDKYREFVETIRQLAMEEGTVGGLGRIREGAIPDGASFADLFGALSGGLGFGAQAATRRLAGAAIKGGLKERVAVGFGKTADARARALSSSGLDLDKWLTELQKPVAPSRVDQVTRAADGRGASAATRALEYLMNNRNRP